MHVLYPVSCVVAVLGAFTGFQLAVAIPGARGARQRVVAAVGAGAAMGMGAVWATHLTAMLAWAAGIAMTWDANTAALAALIAIASCTIGLAVAGCGTFGWIRGCLGGTCIGLGVVATLYEDMAAMSLPVRLRFDTTLAVLAVAIAIVASIAALRFAFNRRGRWHTACSALAMAVAVCGAHCIGMAAMRFAPDPTRATRSGLDGTELGMGLFAIATVLVAVVVSTSVVRRRTRDLVQI